jgi:hypothetical protein
MVRLKILTGIAALWMLWAWPKPVSAADPAPGPRQAAVDAKAQDLSPAANPDAGDLEADNFTRNLSPREDDNNKSGEALAQARSPERQTPSISPALADTVGSKQEQDSDPSQQASGLSRGPLDLTVILPKVTVTGNRDVFSQFDEHLKSLSGALPCAGCDGRRNDDPPRLVQIGAQVAVTTLKALFFSQPRIRGEPNDEALYLAHECVCTPDDPFRCLNRSQLP